MKLRLSKKYIAIILAIVALTVAVYTIVNRQDKTINIDDSTIPLGAQSIPARDAGMVPGDKSAASSNSNLLIRALNQYGSIVIDDSYYIGTPTEALTTRTVEIVGTDDAELIAKDDAYTILFNPADINSLTIKDVNFTNNNIGKSFLVVYNSGTTDNKVENVDIEGCTFDGVISIFRQSGDKSLDPDNFDFGMGKFVFANNKVYNTTLSFIVLRDIPVEQCEINNNTIQNFMYSFLSIGINNGIPYEEKLYNHINYLEVDGNSVMCEDNWWGDTDSGTYYTFVLFEGAEVKYNNNYIEGIKALNDIALYDAYLSAKVVNYTNNTWKNNVCFATNKTNNALLKAKGGGNELIRNYTNNTFIVEADFAERLGQSKENLRVDFISLDQHAESYTISDNLFDIYDLRFPLSSIRISNFRFNNNILKAEKASGNLTDIRLNDDFHTELLEVKTNEIDIKSLATVPFNLIRVVDNRNKNADSLDSISVSGNKISAPISYLFYNVIADDLVFSDNKIVDVNDKFLGFAYKGSFNLSESSGNSIAPDAAFTYNDGRRIFGLNTENGGLYEQGQ